MATISAGQVKELRERSGAGMMECKKALSEAEGDVDKAMKILRERGIAKAEKRASRAAAEGLVELAANDDSTLAAVVELNSETDFVARNEEFQMVAKELAAAALANKVHSAGALQSAQLPGLGKTAEEAVQELLAKIGEKITLNRATVLGGDVVASYLHPPGKIGVLLAAKTAAPNKEAVKDALRNIAMHIAAMNPRFLREEDVDAATIENEKEIAAAIAKKEGKPENIIPKIVEGKVKAFYKEAVLLNQVFAMDTSLTISKVVEQAGKDAGGAVELTGFVRYQVGETVEKTEEAE